MRRKELLLIILLLVALAPYFFLCLYALPFADDFCYAWTSADRVSFAHRFLRQYLGWSGRYSAHVLLCNHPLALGGLQLYQSAILASLVATLGAIFFLVYRTIRKVWVSIIASLVMLLFYLTFMPQLAEGVYWFTGISNYQLSNVSFILHLALFLLWLDSRSSLRFIFYIMASLLLIISIGFNEVGAALIPAYYLMAVIVLHRFKVHSPLAQKTYPAVLTFFIIAFIASAFLIFAPGNLVRGNKFHANFHLLHSLFYASLQTVRFIGTWLLTLPAIALSLFVLSEANRLPDTPILRFNYWFILLLLIFTVYMSAFMPYLTTGILGQHRTINYSFFYFIILWVWMLISFSKEHLEYKRASLNFISVNPFSIIAVCIVAMVFTGNGGRVLRDLRKDNFTTYRKEFMARQDNVIRHPEIVIPALKTVPECFIIVDARGDSTWWVNQCMKYSKIEIK